MPIVFVHGVNNRQEDASYKQGVTEKTEYLKQVFGPQLTPPQTGLQVVFPYWGDLGAKFRWNQASLPKETDEVEALGLVVSGPDSQQSKLWTGEVYRTLGKEVNFAALAQAEDFETSVDLVWDTVAQCGSSDAATVAKHYQSALAYVKANPAPAWAMKPQSNDDFLSNLQTNLEATPGTVALGVGGFFDDVKESVSRLLNAAPDEATAVALALWRQTVHNSASRFLGDIFVYLDTRGTATAPGGIVTRVVDALASARAIANPNDPELTVIGHSLGGVILYDVLTYYRPDIQVDAFITVGSQVGVFEEMTLYRSSKVGRPPDPPTDRLDRPTNINRWLNVYDTNDVFSFSVERIFKDTKDYRFDTGFGINESHSGYFVRPSFYKRLAVRISQP